MKIAIISDIHDNIYNLKKVLHFAKREKIQSLICAGDLGNKETLKYLANNFIRQIFIVYGNADLYNKVEVNKYTNLIFFEKLGFFKIKDLSFALCHQPQFIENILRENNKIDYLFYGHTHRPSIKTKDHIIIANPGSLNDSLQVSSFAVLDALTKKINLELC